MPGINTAHVLLLGKHADNIVSFYAVMKLSGAFNAVNIVSCKNVAIVVIRQLGICRII